MLNHLKITKNKIEIFSLFLFVYIILSALSILLSGILMRNFGLELAEKMGIIQDVLKILKLFIVSYITIAFIKKEFFLKKYFKELARLFVVLFLSNVLFALLANLAYSIGLFKINSVSMVQLLHFDLQLVAYYVIICFFVRRDEIGISSLTQGEHTRRINK